MADVVLEIAVDERQYEALVEKFGEEGRGDNTWVELRLDEPRTDADHLRIYGLL